MADPVGSPAQHALARLRRNVGKVLPAHSVLRSIDRSLQTAKKQRTASAKEQQRQLAALSATLQQLNKTLEDVNRSLTAAAESTRSIDQRVAKVLSEVVVQRKILDIVRVRETYELLEEVRAFAARQQDDLAQTMRRLVDDELSFARFGDGEFRLMTHPEYQLRFQRNSPALMAALRGVLTDAPAPGLLIGFPHIFRDLNGSGVWSAVWRDVSPLLVGDVRYGNSHVTRPLMFEFLGQEQGTALWRSVWQDRHIVIITGEGSRFTLIPQLFDNVASSRFVWSTPTHAFADLDRVCDEVANGPGADLYLISLGPAGTILADRLHREGHRAIDIGHISDSYLAAAGGVWPEKQPLVRAPAKP